MKDPVIVGITNLTPDSFSGDGAYQDSYYNVEEAERIVNKQIENGASLVDIGAESTRPGATPITPEEEWERLRDVLYRVVPGRESSFSIDTHHPETVRRISEELGVVIINDVTGMNNPEMQAAVIECRMPVIIGHLAKQVGTDIQLAHSMRPQPTVSEDQIINELGERVEELVRSGMDKNAIILDPDWGFGKTPELHQHLFRLPGKLPEFQWMLGVSRKRSLRKRNFYGEDLADFSAMNKAELDTWLDARSVEVALKGYESGYRYFRVHNVAAHAAAFLQLART